MDFIFVTSEELISYELEIVTAYPEDGSVIYGTQFINTTTVIMPPNQPIDMRCLEAPTDCALFDNYPAQLLRLTIIGQNEEGELSTPAIGYFYVYGPPSPISIDLSMESGTVGDPLCQATSITNACPVGNNGLAFNATNSSGDIIPMSKWFGPPNQLQIAYILARSGLGTPKPLQLRYSFYRIDIQQVDCSTGLAIGAPLFSGSNTPVAAPSGLFGNLNSLLINGSQGYFADNPAIVDGNCYLFELTLGNACGEATDYSYIYIDPNRYLQTTNHTEGSLRSSDFNRTLERSEEIDVYPNPSGEEVFFRLPTSPDGPYLCRILSPDGRTVRSRPGREGDQDLRLSLAGLPAGVYFYRIEGYRSSNYSGKLIKQ